MAWLWESFWKLVKKYWWIGLLILLLEKAFIFGMGYRKGYYVGMHKSDELREQISKSLLACQKENENLRSKNLKSAPVPMR